jgi:hypothetical protein
MAGRALNQLLLLPPALPYETQPPARSHTLEGISPPHRMLGSISSTIAPHSPWLSRSPTLASSPNSFLRGEGAGEGASAEATERGENCCLLRYQRSCPDFLCCVAVLTLRA